MRRSFLVACRWMPVLLGFAAMAWTVEASAHQYESKFFTVKYNDPGHLDRFAKKIQPGALTRTLNTVFLGKQGASDAAGLGQFLDRLFQRVQIILDMPMPKLHVAIQLHADEQALLAAAARVTGFHINAPAFYSKSTNSIHVQVEKLSIGILAHEMAHAILDHYFVIQPPAKIAEMLCQYVDTEISSGNF